jgi:hypothetical protein
VALLLGTIGIAFALQGGVVGTVRDGDTGLPLAGAVVTLPDLERTTVTGSDGRYALHKVPSGPQHVSVRMIGYAPRSLHALVPPEGRLQLDVSLRAEPTRLRAVEVRAAIPLRGVNDTDTTAFPDRGLSMAAAANHPLLSETDALQALAGGEVVVRPESPSGVHVRGGASDQTAYVLDGIPVFSPYHAAGIFGAWNPDGLSAVRLFSAVPFGGTPHSLSGVIEGVTRAPGDRLRVYGGATTTHARITLDGPLGATAAGYLVSVRSGFPGTFAPRDEASYLRGELGDVMAKVETPLLGGRARLLEYASENELDAASSVQPDSAPSADGDRNTFGWSSHSTGIEWARKYETSSVRVLGWRALGEAASRWAGESDVELASHRRDLGMMAAFERGETRAALRVDHIQTSYRVFSFAESERVLDIGARTAVITLFAQRAVRLRNGLEAEFGASLAAAENEAYPGPRARLTWRPGSDLTLSASYARTHQFAQSLRNSESVVRNVFPADLYVGAASDGIPVARSDQAVLAAEYRPAAALRVGMQAYARAFDGVVMVAPRTTGPFATNTFVAGVGVSHGTSVEAALTGSRYGILASYGWHRVRLEHSDSTYSPEYATTHLLDAGIVLFPTMTTSLRLGASAGVGRRTSVVAGDLEWESCSLLDQGCEFGGSPHNDAGLPGSSELPPYLCVDLGVRKHWHVQLGERDVMIALFGTVSNIFGRRNTLTYLRNPSTGEIAEVGMRPLAPLVIGLDWRF